MKNRQAHRRLRALRLLTLFSFFHFSGVHNGYTVLTTLSPLDVRQSVSLTGAAARSFFLWTSPRSAASILQSRMEAIPRIFSRARTAWGTVMVSARSNPFQVSGAGREGLDGRGESYLKKQDSYIKDKKKEIWTALRTLFLVLPQGGKAPGLQAQPWSRNARAACGETGPRLGVLIKSSTQRLHHDGEGDRFASPLRTQPKSPDLGSFFSTAKLRRFKV